MAWTAEELLAAECVLESWRTGRPYEFVYQERLAKAKAEAKADAEEVKP